ncbi:hypothetical protein [Marinobacterium stanieri]|uniref:hypothetical protein n=1 Tax=Marinobacterium stanieri TaxID=49186 RepID=UPI0011159BB6|nr:hypothetical protein [Marinobacterium stanieri]
MDLQKLISQIDSPLWLINPDSSPPQEIIWSNSSAQDLMGDSTISELRNGELSAVSQPNLSDYKSN